jgi:hypothetical protein
MLVSVSIGRRAPLLAGALALLCLTPAAFASGLPQQASDTAAAVLAKLGVTPISYAGGGASGQHGHGASVSSLARSTDLTGDAKGAAISALASGGKSHARSQSGSSASAGHGHGAQVSTLAQTTTATGVDKGTAISTLASGGKSQAGQHGGQPTGAVSGGHSRSGSGG